MTITKRGWARTAVVAALAAAALSCQQSDLGKDAAPVALLVSTTQTLNRIDLAPNAENCDQSIATINMNVIEKNPGSGSTNTTFNQVRITRYQVSYVRTDGGRQVPSSFVRTMDSLLTVGTSGALTNFLILTPEAVNLAPFVALRPINGGRDPDTGLGVVRMDVIVDIFGETLAGENVSARTRIPLDFCYGCQGCA